MTMERTATATPYGTDFAMWTESQASALRDRRWADLDVHNLTEEISALAKRDRRELRSRLTVLVMHLLKLKYQPEMASGSWRSTIREQNDQITAILEDSPSLAPEMNDLMEAVYAIARSNASDETGLPIETFPNAVDETDLLRLLREVIGAEDSR